MRRRAEQPIVPLLLRELETGPATDRDLSSVLGIHHKNVRLYCNLLHEEGRIRISDWERKQGSPIAVWALRGKYTHVQDKPKPAGGTSGGA